MKPLLAYADPESDQCCGTEGGWLVRLVLEWDGGKYWSGVMYIPGTGLGNWLERYVA